MWSPYPLGSSKLEADMSSSFIAKSVDCSKARIASIQASWEGEKIFGFLTVEGSNDNEIFGVVSDVKPHEIAHENRGSVCLNIPYIGYNFIRLSYQYVGGSGKLKAHISLKG